MKDSMDYLELCGLTHTLDHFLAKEVINTALSEKEIIVKEWITNRIAELEKK